MCYYTAPGSLWVPLLLIYDDHIYTAWTTGGVGYGTPAARFIHTRDNTGLLRLRGFASFVEDFYPIAGLLLAPLTHGLTRTALAGPPDAPAGPVAASEPHVVKLRLDRDARGQGLHSVTLAGAALKAPDGTFPNRTKDPAFWLALETAVVENGFDTDDDTVFLYRGREIARWRGAKLERLFK